MIRVCPIRPHLRIPDDPYRGELAWQGFYNEAGQLLKSVAYNPSFQLDPIKTPGIIHRFFVTGYISSAINSDPMAMDPENLQPSNNVVPTGVYTFTEYMMQTSRKISEQVTTTIYDNTNGTALTDISTQYYASTFHNFPTQIISTTSKGETVTKNYKYASDFRISNYTVPDQLSTYNTNLASDESYLGPALAPYNNPNDPYYYWNRLNVFTNYRYMKAIDRQTYIAWRRQNFTDPTNNYQTSHNTAKANADALLKPILELQDAGENPVIEFSDLKNGKLNEANYTSYGYPPGITNAVYPLEN